MVPRPKPDGRAATEHRPSVPTPRDGGPRGVGTLVPTRRTGAATTSSPGRGGHPVTVSAHPPSPAPSSDPAPPPASGSAAAETAGGDAPGRAAEELSYPAVLVPLDGSDLAERALAPARWLAASLGVGVHVVTAAPPGDPRPAGTGGAAAPSHLDALGARVPEAAVHVVAASTPGRAIVTTARELGGALVCMSTRGRSRTAALAGSTFVDVAAGLGAPLVAIGSRVRWATALSGARVVVSLDGYPAAERLLAPAGAWARRLGLRVSLVTATDPLLVGHGESGRRSQYGPDHDPVAYLDELAGRPELAGVDVDTRVLWGSVSPHVSLGEHLDEHPATLVLATTRSRRRRLARAALGSKVARIIHRSPAPVLAHPVPRA